MASDSTSPLRRMVSSVVAPATVTTALLYYFGWVRSQTIANHFGYEASILGFGPQDYILRAVQPVGTLAVVGGIAGWFALVAHRHAEARLHKGRFRALVGRRRTHALQALGAFAAVLSFIWTWIGFADASYLLPFLFAVAAFGVGYGTWLNGFSRPTLERGGFRLASEAVWVVSSLVAAGIFVLTTVYARETGNIQAMHNVARTRTAAVVTLSSSEPLDLPGVPSWSEGDLSLATGLVLMFTADGSHFLLPIDYDAATNARVYTVPVAGVRVNFDSSWGIPCNGFEDLPIGQSYGSGEVFTSAGVRYLVTPSLLGPKRDEHGRAKVSVVAAADGGQQLQLRDAVISPQFDARYRQWRLVYEQRSDGAELAVNDRSFVETAVLGLAVVPELNQLIDVEIEGAVTGELIATANGIGLHQLSFGGLDLAVDCPRNVPPHSSLGQ